MAESKNDREREREREINELSSKEEHFRCFSLIFQTIIRPGRSP